VIIGKCRVLKMIALSKILQSDLDFLPLKLTAGLFNNFFCKNGREAIGRFKGSVEIDFVITLNELSRVRDPLSQIDKLTLYWPGLTSFETLIIIPLTRLLQ
jgi:hypothetical protein